MSTEEYETFEVVSYEDIHDVFPWFSLSYHDLLDKLELIYAADDDIRQIPNFAYSVVQSLRKLQTAKPKMLEEIFNYPLILPIVKESLVFNDTFENNKTIKKNTESHRPLVSAYDLEGIRIYHEAYLPDYTTDDTVTYGSNSIVKDTIVDLDVVNLLEKNKNLDFRAMPEETQMALHSLYLNLSKLGTIMHYNHNGAMSTTDSIPQDVIRLVKFLFASKIYQIKNVTGLKEIKFIIDYIAHIRKKYFENFLLQYVNNTEYIFPPVTFPKENYYVRIAKELKTYYRFLVPSVNGYSAQFFIYDVMRELDFGGFGLTFSLIMNDYDELPDAEFSAMFKDILSAVIGNKNGNNIIDASLIAILRKKYLIYKQIITNNIIENKKQKTLDERNTKDQVYRSLVLTMYGVKKYNLLVQKSKQVKNPVFFELVSEAEAEEIETRYAEILAYREKIRNSKCKHNIIRKDYDLLPLNEKQKHSILLDLVEKYASSNRTQLQKNNKQIICSHDDLIIACEHEVLLAKWYLAKVEEKQALFDKLTEIFIINDYNYDEGICKFCGRRIEETKTLIMATEYDSFQQPVKKLRLTLNDTREIEDAVIRAVSSTEPLKGVDDMVQRMMALFTWEDVRRITDNVEFSIMEYYGLISQKKDSLERVYKNLAKVCVIYSHLIYEATSFRPESEKYFITPDYPWVETSTNRTIDAYLKRAKFMIRLRFPNIANDANKISNTMLKDYLATMYKRYISEKGKFKMSAISSVDRWTGLHYKMSITDIMAVQNKIISSFSSPIGKDATDAKVYATEFMEKYSRSPLPKHPQEFINLWTSQDAKAAREEYANNAGMMPRIIIGKLSGQTFSRIYTEPNVYLINEYTAELPEITPTDYNKYGIAQNWDKILISYKEDNKENVFVFPDAEYKNIVKIYNLFYTSSYNAENVLPDKFILPNDSRITKTDYENLSGEKKSALKTEKYNTAEQDAIRKKIEEQKIISSMYDYASNTQNKSFNKTLKDKVKFSKEKGYITEDYKSLLAEFTHQLSLERNQKENSDTKNKIDESSIKIALPRINPTSAIQFRDLSLKFVETLGKHAEIYDKFLLDNYYKGIVSLGRKTIQEQEELDGYWGLSDKLKELSSEEIITLHTQYQIDRIKNYIRAIYTAINNLFYYNENDTSIYNTFQGRMVMKYIGKFKIPIVAVQTLLAKRLRKKNRLARNDELEFLFSRFIELCTIVLTINKFAASMIKEFIDLFLEQDKSLNLDRKYRDYQNEYREAMFQFRYDKEVLRKKLQFNDIEFTNTEDTEEQDPGDEAIFHERPKNKQRELYAAAREFGQDLHSRVDAMSDHL